MQIKVLLADDRTLVREGLRRILEQYEGLGVVAAAASAAQALSEAARAGPQVALVEAGLPEAGGVEAARALVAAQPAIGVIVFSFRQSGALARRAAEAGARGYLGADATPEELAQAVRAVARGERHFAKDADKPDPREPGGGDPLEALTPKERDIVRLVAAGKSNAETAALMKLSPRTVETYRIRLMRKLDLEHLPALVKFAIRNGIATLD